MAPAEMRASIRAGAIGGSVVVYLAAVGMIERFDSTVLLGRSVTLGRLLLITPALVAGVLLARHKVTGGTRSRPPMAASIRSAAVAGAALGATSWLGVAVVRAFGADDVREIFIAATPRLLEILTFGNELALALPVMMIAGAIATAGGAAITYVDAAYRRPAVVGLVAALAGALLQRTLPVGLRQLGLQTTWLYDPVAGGITLAGALLLFAVGAGGMWARDRVMARPPRQPGPAKTRADISKAIIFVGALVALPYVGGTVLSDVLGLVGVYVLMGLGLNIVVGFAGLLDLGYVAFFAVGAYATALLTGANVIDPLGGLEKSVDLSLNFYVAVPLVVLIAAVVGLAIGAPVLRLRGDYLAIVTLGFGEIARVLVTSDWLRTWIGGAQGMRDVTDAAIGPVGFRDDPRVFYYLILVFCIAAVIVVQRLSRSRIGRAWNAMREDEQVAEVTGISTVRYKLLAFAVGGGVGSLSGALFAVKIGSLTPASFTILVSITVLAVVILGGTGSVLGVVAGSIVLLGLPGALKEFEEYQLLVYGAALVAVMILRPQGMIPAVRRGRSIQEEERRGDVWLKPEEADIES